MPRDVKIVKPYLTTQQAALLFGVSLQTVQNWTKSGLLDFWKTEGGHRRISRESVTQMLSESNLLADTKAADPAADDTQSTKSVKILVIEDNLDLLRLYALQIATWAFATKITTATNGMEGLLQLGSEVPDLLITDLHMPRMNGFWMLQVLRSIPKFDAMEIVVVTGLDKASISKEGVLPKGITIFPKPIPFEEIKKISESLLAKRQQIL